MAITHDQVERLMTTVRDLYMADDIPWVIGYSGGKDSTATLQLVWLSMRGLPVAERKKKKIYIINTDTLVESPYISKWVKRSLKIMDEKSLEEGLPFITQRLTPDIDNTFWVNLIGRGYPFPRKKFRWCTDRLKIQPVNKFITTKIAEHGEIILVLGTRKAESSRRAHTMETLEKKRVRELLSPNPTLANEFVFSPLESWTDDDVWTFLMQYKNPWGLSNMDLLTLYRGATADNECPLQVDKDLPTCGKSRFGCWVCTMVERDKSLGAMISNDESKEWMTELLDFRNEFGDEEGDRERRSFRRMSGKIQGSYQRLYHGPYTMETRNTWLRRLLMIQKHIQEEGPEEFRDLELISVPELRKIRRIWVFDKHEFNDVLPDIYKEVIGKEFDDPDWITSTAFGKKEWQTLKSECEHVAGDESLAFEMMYSLVDIENQASVLNDRKKVLDKLESCIKSNFYKDEDDATDYYRTKLTREDDMGGDVSDKKFLQEFHESHVNYVTDDEGVDQDVDA